MTWRNRPLDAVWPIIYTDALRVKIRSGSVTSKPVYPAVGVDMDGRKGVRLWFGAEASVRPPTPRAKHCCAMRPRAWSPWRTAPDASPMRRQPRSAIRTPEPRGQRLRRRSSMRFSPGQISRSRRGERSGRPCRRWATSRATRSSPRSATSTCCHCPATIPADRRGSGRMIRPWWTPRASRLSPRASRTTYGPL
ncbi:transposase [Streptomyces sp. NPDC056480]|uniref:transposase n=1 Tax=Streptomyces sp. NPDC056480 TaxID=3345833 RepID=UPI0036854A13